MDADYINAHKTTLTLRMFVETADNNYALARYAYLNGLLIDFLWLSLHAVEKYLKSILLLNGKSIKPYGHNIEKLFNSTLKLDKRLIFPELEKPTNLKSTFWFNETMEHFIQRLNELGHTKNRYLTTSVYSYPGDLHRLDHLIYHTRRYCRRFDVIIIPDKNLTELDLLSRDANYWELSSSMLIEKAYRTPKENYLYEALMMHNLAFYPDSDPDSQEYLLSVSSINSPISMLVNWEKDETKKEILKWILENIPLDNSDKKEISEIIDS